MKLMLPTNWDPELIAQIAPFKPDYIYGSLPSEATLRSSLMLSSASEDDIALHVSQAAQHGIRLVYVMNATCLGNKEFSDEGRGQMLQRLQWLVDIGAAAVVTANPFVMELVRENFPDLELHISVLASVNDARKAKYFDDLGATVIHLDPQVNRDFRRLKAIRKAVGCRLSLVVNEGCLLSCPIRGYHSNMISHSGESIAQPILRRLLLLPLLAYQGKRPRRVCSFTMGQTRRPVHLRRFGDRPVQDCRPRKDGRGAEFAHRLDRNGRERVPLQALRGHRAPPRRHPTALQAFRRRARAVERPNRECRVGRLPPLLPGRPLRARLQPV